MTIIISLLFITIALTLVSRQQHILPRIICLESLILLIVYLLPLTINNKSIIINPIIRIVLSIRVSRASIGLRLLTITRRKEGNDSRSNHTTNLC